MQDQLFCSDAHDQSLSQDDNLTRYTNYIKTMWFIKNYVNHEKLADDFLVERNRADLQLHFLQ